MIVIKMSFIIKMSRLAIFLYITSSLIVSDSLGNKFASPPEELDAEYKLGGKKGIYFYPVVDSSRKVSTIRNVDPVAEFKSYHPDLRKALRSWWYKLNGAQEGPINPGFIDSRVSDSSSEIEFLDETQANRKLQDSHTSTSRPADAHRSLTGRLSDVISPIEGMMTNMRQRTMID